MKSKSRILWLTTIALLYCQFLIAQDVIINSGSYDKNPYPTYNPNGSVLGTYTVQISKDAYTFSAGQFTINIAFHAGAVYAGGGTLPSEFQVTEGSDGSSSLVISIVSNWSGATPASRTLQIPIKIVAASDEDPTQTVIGWLDPFVTENVAGNSNGDPLNVTNALPVSLASFNVTKEKNTVNLAWKTTEETNSDYFEVQHSTNTKNWVVIGKVQSHNTGKAIQTYSLPHANPVAGVNYYRLKMVDVDHSFAYSDIKSIRMEEGAVKAEFYVYPNPVVEKVMVQNYEQIVEATVLSQSGASLLKANKITADGVNVSNLQNGLYMIQVKDINGNISIKKFVIKK